MKKCLLMAVACLLLSSCASTKLYSWYDYEDATYEFNKAPDEELQKKVIEQYEKMINKQTETRGVVPPGLYAEYGYMLCKMNRIAEGIEFLKKEIALYPESEVYISRIIKAFEK